MRHHHRAGSSVQKPGPATHATQTPSSKHESKSPTKSAINPLSGTSSTRVLQDYSTTMVTGPAASKSPTIFKSLDATANPSETFGQPVFSLKGNDFTPSLCRAQEKRHGLMRMQKRPFKACSRRSGIVPIKRTRNHTRNRSRNHMMSRPRRSITREPIGNSTGSSMVFTKQTRIVQDSKHVLMFVHSRMYM